MRMLPRKPAALTLTPRRPSDAADLGLVVARQTGRSDRLRRADYRHLFYHLESIMSRPSSNVVEWFTALEPCRVEVVTSRRTIRGWAK